MAWFVSMSLSVKIYRNQHFIINEVSLLYRWITPEIEADYSKNSLMVTLIEANWNLICEEILRWINILKGVQWSLPLPVQLGT